MSLLTEPWYPEDNELEHYGVLGMKWGVRKNKKLKNTFPMSSKRQRYEELKRMGVVGPVRVIKDPPRSAKAANNTRVKELSYAGLLKKGNDWILKHRRVMEERI